MGQAGTRETQEVGVAALFFSSFKMGARGRFGSFAAVGRRDRKGQSSSSGGAKRVPDGGEPLSVCLRRVE